MEDPSLALQGTIFAALRASVALTTIVGTRVLDQVEADTPLPYVTVGEGLSVPDKASCVDGMESFPVVRCFSNGPGYPEVKRMAAAVVAALDENYTLEIAGHRLVEIELEDLRYRRDADGLTSIADLTFRVLTEPVPA